MMNKTFRVIVASKDSAISQMVSEILTKLVTHREIRIESKRLLSGASVLEELGSEDREALALEDKVRIVILDNELQDGKGSPLLGKIKEGDPDTKIIFVADRISEQFELAVRQAGIHYFSAKPLQKEVLSKVLQKIIDHDTAKMLVMKP